MRVPRIPRPGKAERLHHFQPDRARDVADVPGLVRLAREEGDQDLSRRWLGGLLLVFLVFVVVGIVKGRGRATVRSGGRWGGGGGGRGVVPLALAPWWFARRRRGGRGAAVGREVRWGDDEEGKAGDEEVPDQLLVRAGLAVNVGAAAAGVGEVEDYFREALTASGGAEEGFAVGGGEAGCVDAVVEYCCCCCCCWAFGGRRCRVGWGGIG